jgi:16S rRNA (guanine527-N7)-methyltransferase
MTPRDALERGAAELGIALPGEAREQLIAYVALLAKWNASYNLTAVREPTAMVTHHLLDSLAVVPHLPLEESDASLADAGSGAGLPGIALALARPNWRVALIEANQKKAAFLRQAKIELALANVEVHESRVESLRPAQAFAVVISRAFAELADFITACRHLVAKAGVFAAMKGKYPEGELASLPADVRCTRVVALRVPLLSAERHLVLCEKLA